MLQRGADPPIPAKNLVMRTVCVSFAVAVPKEEIAHMKNGIKTEIFRPYASETGAKRRGPKAFLKTDSVLLDYFSLFVVVVVVVGG